MKKTALSVALLLGTFALAAQDGYVADFQKKWQNAAQYTLEVAEKMPEDAYDFKPVPEEMSFKEQLLHIAGNIAWLSSSYLGAQRPPYDLKKKDYSKAQLLDMLREGYRLAGEAAAKLTAAQLEEKVEFFAGPMNKRQILTLLNDHQTHHRGQLIVYLRLKGVKPPDYRGW